MKSIEFCYWLKGFFDLQEPTTINEAQTTLIKQHLDLVYKNPVEIMPFCAFLKGYFTMSNPTTIGVEETQVIREDLNSVFKIEPEPYYPTHKTDNNINNMVIRC